MFSKHSQLKNSLSGADSFDDSQMEIVKGVRSLKSCRLLKVLIIVIRAQSHSVEAPLPPWFGGGDHLCLYGRKLIGSLVPVHLQKPI